MGKAQLPGVEIPREFWPTNNSHGGPLPRFLEHNPARIWVLSSHPQWLICLVIMPGPVGWACLMGPTNLLGTTPQGTGSVFEPICPDIWTLGLDWFRQLGCPMVQFLKADRPANGPPLSLPKGFAPIAEFWDLRWQYPTDSPTPPTLGKRSWAKSQAKDCGDIAVQTMSGSLDCPALTSFRSDALAWDSLIQIHGKNSPCWILEWEDSAVGVLLGQLPESGLFDFPQTGTISYFGLIPSFRGKNLGCGFLTDFLYFEVPKKGAMTTMVDAGNLPALRAYQKTGFEKIGTSRLFFITL